MKVDLIMLCHNRVDYTRKALKALLNQTHSDFGLTIWNNASTDGTKDFLDTIKDKRVSVVHSETNDRLADVTSRLFLMSDADLVGKIDNDTLVPEDWLERCVEAHNAYHFGFIGGFHFLPEDLINKTPIITKYNGISVWEKPYIGGCSFVIRREDFKNPIEIKGEDQRIFMGLSDFQVEFDKQGLVNGYLWNPILYVDHMEDTRSPNFIGTPEYQSYKMTMRGMSLEQNTEESFKKADTYLDINTNEAIN